MAKQGFDPEEQLLDLIEKGESFSPSKLRRRKVVFFSLTKFKVLFIAFGKWIKAQVAKLKTLTKNPKVANRCLVGVFVILGIYLISDFTLSRLDINQVVTKGSIDRKPYFLKKPSIDVRQFLYYLEMVQRRNIFSPVVLKSAENIEAEAKKVIDNLVSNLGLVGISWGTEPEAMVEDRKAKKTYFLRSGDMVNKLKVEDVLKNSVVLSFEGKQVELK